MKYYFTSESVTEGHPDKICDKIADKILDSALSVDKESKMAVEATIKDDLILIYGEAKTKAVLDYEKIAKEVLKDIGYTEEFNVIVKVSEQSNEINSAVVKNKICAGDQGIMFGYATNETKNFMPLPIYYANKLAKKLTEVRKNDKNTPLKPDGKTQVTVEYINDKPVRIDTIIISCQHIKNISQESLKNYIIKNVINKVVPKELIDNNTKYLINTSGSFTIGGPFGDSGTTGRKIVVDTYGGFSKVGGGCFSSKDPSKVDRSAAYYARYVAKNVVAHQLCDRCEIQISYAIGKEYPTSIYIDTFNTNKVDIKEIYNYVNKNFDFSVDNIIKELDLLRPIYYKVAAYGHFGREDLDLPWEKIKN
ncbi:MAG: methionine adenosyltransferase [bacterium]|nr:methionine adenosyltransferase [bacterium]